MGAGPLEATPQRDLLSRAAPFVAIMLLAFASLAISRAESTPGVLAAAAVLMVVIFASLALAVRLNLSPRWLTAQAFATLVVIALLRHGEGGATSGFGVLTLVPVLWLALYGSRRALIALIAAVAVLFVTPIIVFGPPDYPTAEWRRAALVTAMAAFVGLTTRSLVERLRRREREAVRVAEHERQREAYLRAVMNSAAEGILALDLDGRISFANPSAARMLGHSAEQLVDSDLHELVHHTRPDGSPYPKDDCPVHDSLRSGRRHVVADELFWRADGTSFPVEYRSTAIQSDEGIAGAVLTFGDISRRREVERMKNEFISVVSHELRTPLTSIRGSLGLMQGGMVGELSEDAERMLTIAINNSDRLVRLINDILDVERIESGKAPMDFHPCRLDELAAQAREAIAQTAADAGVTVHLEVPPTPLHADPDRIVQTLINLVGNAIKFSPEGGTVTVIGEHRPGNARISVRDQGPGIPPDKRMRIFERFAQIDSADTRQKGGSGLGLAIARGIVEQHGGRIWVEGAPGGGAQFAFELPVAEPTAAGEGTASPEGSGALIVEDDPDLAAVLVGALTNHGVDARAVLDAEAAQVLLTQSRPGVVTVDLALPGDQGDALIRWMRSQPELDTTSLVVYTALDLEEDRLRRLREHAEVVTKAQVSPDELAVRLVPLANRAAEPERPAPGG